MVQRNEHTGNKLQTDVPSEEYRIGWDNIFGKKQKDIEEYIERDIDKELAKQLQEKDIV